MVTVLASCPDGVRAKCKRFAIETKSRCVTITAAQPIAFRDSTGALVFRTFGTVFFDRSELPKTIARKSHDDGSIELPARPIRSGFLVGDYSRRVARTERVWQSLD